MSTTIRTIERKPQVASPGKTPLLLMLHGFGSNEHDLISLAPYLDPRLHIISARGIYELGYGSYAWYPLYGTLGNLIADEAARDQALEILQKFVATLPERSGTDPQQLYLLGFSQGGMMSLGLALTNPELFAGVIPVSGWLDPALEPRASATGLNNLDMLIIHGEEDDVVPVEGSRRARDFLTSAEAQVAYHEYPVGHTIHPDAVGVVRSWLEQRLDSPPR